MKLSTKGFSQGLPGVMKIVLILFLFVQPLAAWRKVNVRKQRTKVDWALEIQQLLEEDFPDAARLILVCDNLNTHKPGSLYEAFEPRKARRLAKRLRIHYTPKCQLPRYIPHPFTRVITPVGDQHHLVSVDFGRLCLGKVFPGTLLLSDCNRSLYPASASRVAALGFD